MQISNDDKQHVIEINGKSFTKREIDIVACILNGRSVKKIASLLCISPKTVESHIRNVGLKFGLSSQESIIDFIEKSDTYTQLKNHYLNLDPSLERFKEENIYQIKKHVTTKEKNTTKYKKYFLPFISVGVVLLGLCLIAQKAIWNSPTNNELTAIIQPGRSTTWNVPRQDHKFIGREDLLRELHDKLHNKSNSQAYVAVCAGLGGIGKTQLALNYVHNNKNHYTLNAWFAAENLEQLKQQYIEFAYALGYKDSESSFAGAKLFINKWLQANPGWLFVYDNVESYDLIQNFLPDSKGHIILTTRQQTWPNTFNKLDIELMSEQESMDLIDSFIQFRKNNVADSDIKNLVKTLGYLPLALAQAGAYMQYNGITAAQYLNLYKKHEEYVLNNNVLPEGTSHLPVSTTWDMSFNAIIADSKKNGQQPISIELLNICAYLAPEKIPSALLLNWLKKAHPELSDHQLELRNSLGQLRKYSMITYDNDDNVIVHRLVQAALRDKNKSVLTKAWFTNIIYATHQLYNLNTHILEDEQRHRDLLPHLQILLKHYKEFWPKNSEHDVATILNDIGTVFYQSTDYEQAQIYYERALKVLQQKYPQGHLDLAITQDLLGNAYRNLGLEIEAKKLHAQALAYLQKHDGKNRDRLADVIDHLGRAQRMQGDSFAAKKLHTQSLAIKEELYGKDHIEVALQLDQLGRDTRNLLEPRQAKDLLERSLKIKEKYYGKNHLEVAITIDYLGRCYRYMGDIKKAKEMHTKSIKIKEGIFGPDHIAVAYTLDQLGRDLRYLGDLEQAKLLHTRSVKIKSDHYGPDHVEVAYSSDYLARVYRVMGNVTAAKEIHEKNLEIKNKHYGKDSLASGYAAEQLARDFRELGNHEKALELHHYALNLISKNKYKNNTTMAIVYEQLGLDYKLSGNFSKALELHNQTLQIKLQHYGEDHPEIAKTYTYMGIELIELGDILKGKEYLQKSLKIKESYYGKNNIYLVDTLQGLGKAHQLLGNSYRAKSYIKKANSILSATHR